MSRNRHYVLVLLDVTISMISSKHTSNESTTIIESYPMTTNIPSINIRSEHVTPIWIYLLYWVALIILVTLTVLLIKNAIKAFKRIHSTQSVHRHDPVLSLTPHSRTHSVPKDNMYTPSAETTIQHHPNHNDQLQEVSVWLTILGLPQYLQNFAFNGYESMALIKDINDPKHLLDIGIEDERHRITLMAAIQLSLASIHHFNHVIDHIDSILNVKQDAVSEKHFDKNRIHDLKQWLNAIGVVQYLENFWLNGYESLEYVRDINNVQDFEDMGIVDQEHQMKLMEAVIALNTDMYNVECEKRRGSTN